MLLRSVDSSPGSSPNPDPNHGELEPPSHPTVVRVATPERTMSPTMERPWQMPQLLEKVKR